ncbi:MAG: hypothetical protein QF473_11435, partial [Planctomycetota bacterium]|nr:hypothetical protein [Planctomycetota bacterium]
MAGEKHALSACRFIDSVLALSALSQFLDSHVAVPDLAAVVLQADVAAAREILQSGMVLVLRSIRILVMIIPLIDIHLGDLLVILLEFVLVVFDCFV